MCSCSIFMIPERSCGRYLMQKDTVTRLGLEQNLWSWSFHHSAEENRLIFCCMIKFKTFISIHFITYELRYPEMPWLLKLINSRHKNNFYYILKFIFRPNTGKSPDMNYTSCQLNSCHYLILIIPLFLSLSFKYSEYIYIHCSSLLNFILILAIGLQSRITFNWY